MIDNKDEAQEAEDFEQSPVFTLTDEETGEENDFILLARTTIDDQLYYALEPADEETDEYVILRVTEDGDDILLETIEDDDEFDKVEDAFNDLFFNEDVDYDE